jgi:hypothetical protein
MASTYTANTGIEKIGSGEQAGSWGTTTNTNFDIIDDALNGVITLTISGNTTLTSSDGTLSNGHHKVLLLSGTPSGAFNLTIDPNDQQKWYFINNATGQVATVLQGGGSGTTVTINNGTSAIVYADGSGSNANVGTISTDVIGDTSPQLGGNLDTNGKLIKFGDAGTAGTDDTLEFGASDDMQLYHDGTNSFIANKTGALKIATETSGIAVTIGHTTSETTIADNATITGTASVGGNLTIAGSEIVTASSITLDCGGDINFDASGTDINFKVDGTTFLIVDKSGNNARFENPISDGDLLFRGSDGGSSIQALQLDMSAAGAATFNNDITAFSDRRLKTDITNIENALPKVMRMQGVYYKRNDVEDAKEQVGVIAQDMETIVPEVVLTADDEMQTKSVDYGKLCAVLIESIKELKAEIDELKKK